MYKYPQPAKRLIALLLACLLALSLAPTTFAQEANETEITAEIIIAQDEDEPEPPEPTLWEKIRDTLLSAGGYLLNLIEWSPWTLVIIIPLGLVMVIVFALALLSNLVTWPIQLPLGVIFGIILIWRGLF